MENNLAEMWKWCINYTKSSDQKDQHIAPLFFKTFKEAEYFNGQNIPQGEIQRVLEVRTIEVDLK